VRHPRDGYTKAVTRWEMDIKTVSPEKGEDRKTHPLIADGRGNQELGVVHIQNESCN